MSFTYTVRDALGNTVDGSLDLETREAATQRLRRDGYQIVALEEEDEGGLIPRGVGAGDIIYLTSQLAVMVDTGITLSTALNSIAAQEANSTLKGILEDLRRRVEGGEDFSAALAQHPKYFDKTYVALIRASEHTGTLGAMLETISGDLRSRVDMKHKVRAAMAYPVVMLCIAVAVTIFLLTYILPKFEPLFTRKGMKLPAITRVLMSASGLLLNYWYLWLAAAVALGIAYFVCRQSAAGRRWFDTIRINLPVVGTLCRKIIISRSLRTLGTMVASGVSMLDAIRLTGEVAGNCLYEAAWENVLERITQGERIAASLQGNKLFPPTLVQMIDAGEETGKLDLVLRKVSGYYDREVETSIKACTSLIEPLLICAMGFIVGSIALGLLLPIFSLSRPSG
jgi:type IV pilus assembly protein PilC